MVTRQADLQTLVEKWLRARPLSLPEPMTILEQAVPPQLQDTITTHEPYRSQALADGRLWLGIPLLAGIGLEIDLIDPEIKPFAHWSEAITTLKIRLTWSRDMSGREIDYGFEIIHQVAVEEGKWRLVSFWDGAARQEMAKIRQLWAELAPEESD